MPVLKSGRYEVGYLDAGSGPAVILVHSAASNYKQWRKLIEDYGDAYRFLALNLFGYGNTSLWPDNKVQSMEDQVALVSSVCELVDESVFLVGHSFGASVAAWTAKDLGEKIRALVLLEANPFTLLEKENNHGGYDEILLLREVIKSEGEKGNWLLVAEYFVNYWLGDGMWEKLPEDRREVFCAALPNNYHEWDSIMGMPADESSWLSIDANTLYMRSRQTVNSIRGIYEVLQGIRPDWEFLTIEDGGHMAPMTHPDIVNPHIIDFLQRNR